jgi:3-oxoacyl-[acyl-carrier-protein] synthase I
MDPLAITSFTLVNGLGSGKAAVLQALREGRSALHACDFETVDIGTYIARVEALADVRVCARLADYDCRNNRLAQLALESDGFRDAAFRARDKYGSARVGVFVGTSTSGLLEAELAYRRRDPASGALPRAFIYASTQNSFSVADFVQRYLDLAGPVVCVSSACSSSAKVFGNAARALAAGFCDAAIVGGVDTLCLTTLYGFDSLELLSREPCRPFDRERAGISIGEGGGFALLERRTDGADPLLLGVGESSDAFHMSTPHPEGLGARLAMERALAAARLQPAAVDYVNLHGTASRSNDAAEDKAVCTLLGRDTPVSSTKGATGHLLGAAGITEAIIALLAIEHQWLPGSPHTRAVDPRLESHYLLQPMTAPVEVALTNSFGFGGSNCSLALGSPR